MKSIFRFFAERHLLASLLTVMIFLLGLNTLLNIKRSIYPHADMGIMNILTIYPGASPEDAELNVTNKIEEAIEDISGIDHFTSVSMANISTIDVYINLDARDTKKIKAEVRDAVSRVTDLPPAVTEKPLVTEMNTAEVDVMELGIVGDVPYTKLRAQAKLLEKKLKNVPGVVRLDRFGYREREIQIAAAPDSLVKYQVSLHNIAAAIQQRNIQGTTGAFSTQSSEKDIVAAAQLNRPQDVAEVIVRSSFDGPQLRVADLARVQDGYEEEKYLSRLNGEPGISFLVFLGEDADVIRTCDAIHALVQQENKLLPEEMRIQVINDESRYVRNSFSVMLSNGLMGLGLVLLILPLFMPIRIAFWVAAGIPVSLLGAVFLLPLFGQHLDTIGLTGMILVLGIIVDDAIVISENITSKREQGLPPLQAVVDGIHEVFWPVVNSMLTTVLVFVPMFFLPGVMGASVIPIPLAIILALAISLLESSLCLPAHLLHGIKKAPANKPARRWFSIVARGYARFLRFSLRLRYAILLIFIGLLVVSIWYGANHIRFVLFPTGTAEHVIITNELPVGTPLVKTSQRTKELEKVIAQLPAEEKISYSSRTGVNISAGGMHGAEAQNFGMISINLTPFTERQRDTDAIVDELRQKMAALPGQGDITFSIVGTAPPVGKPISLRIVGAEDGRRKQLADSVLVFLSKIDGVKDITRDDKTGKEQIELKLDYDKLARLGLTVAEVAQYVRTAYDGQVVTSLRSGDEDVDLRLLLAEKSRRSLADLEKLLIPNSSGRQIPLGEVATLAAKPGIANLRHFDGERAITVEADIDQDKITAMQVTDAVFAHFNIDRDWPGLQIAIAGELFETEQSMQALLRAFLIALVGIYFLLVLQFNSFTQPFLVMTAIPFGIMGVIFVFGFHGEIFSFMSIMGIIGLCGVVVNDSLVLVDHLNALRRQSPELPLREIIVAGAADRLRPVILTSVTTVAAILPLAYGLGGTSPFMAPLALALGWGLLFATSLTLLLLPVLFMISGDALRLFGRKKK